MSPEINNTNRIIGERILVPTKLTDEKPKKQVYLKNISAEDLKSLKNEDAFMYYSIPFVRSAELLMKDIDVSNLGASGQAAPGHGAQQSQIVSRSSRISTECHPDLLYEDLFFEITRVLSDSG